MNYEYKVFGYVYTFHLPVKCKCSIKEKAMTMNRRGYNGGRGMVVEALL